MIASRDSEPRLVRVLAYIVVAGIAFSAVNMRAVHALFLVFGLLLWVFSLGYKSKSMFLASQPAFAWLVAFLVWSALSLFWSPSDHSLRDLVVYVLKLFSIVVLAYFIDRYQLQMVFLKSLLAGFIFLVLVVLYLQVASSNALGLSADGVFFNPLAQAAAVSVLACCALHELLTSKQIRHRLMHALLFVCATYLVLIVSQQRLGYVSFFVGSSAVLLLCLKGRSRWQFIALLLFVLLLNYFLNHTFSSRINSAFEELLTYEFSSNFTSIGSRLHMWATSLLAIQDNWLWGNGFGSYGHVMPARFGDITMCEIGCVQPHNQFLLVWLETGIVGLFLLLGFVASLAKKLIKDYIHHKQLHHGLFVVVPIFILASLVDSTLFYIGYLHLFVPLFAFLLVPVRYPSISKKDLKLESF